ncbi:ribosomal protein S18 acetylase RimI-like enzyme [Flavobacteriaceae bacterium MAR_2009_75]|nr:ribosomal protein S18 acetylase RimI-like enzyme [Flavobacteriaceae bacterium MAR_2009_75]
MALSLKICTSDELKILVDISRKTFVDAFEEQNNPEDFKTYIDSAFSEEVLSKELSNNDSAFFFVYKDDKLAGYIKINEGQAQTDIKDPEALELERIYVLEAFQGQKIGKWLLEKIKNLAIEKRKGLIWLGVWEKNTDAIKFYQNYGFSKFGTHPYIIGSDKQTDWLMRYKLD